LGVERGAWGEMMFCVPRFLFSSIKNLSSYQQ